MRLVRTITLGAALASTTSTVMAHVAPSVDENNRYLKLTPLGDRVRLAYIVFYGERPGAGLRPTIDTSHDGAISDAEAQAFAQKLAAELAPALEVSIDGAPQQVAFRTVSAGMGSSRVAAGSFSVDLVAYLCLPSVRGRHEVRLFDRFRVARPGETEVRVEDSPGVRIERVRVGAHVDEQGGFRFVGPGGPLSDDGLELVFTAGAESLVPTDGTCGAGGGAARGGSQLLLYAGAGAVAAAGAIAAALASRARARRRRT